MTKYKSKPMDEGI